MAEGYAECRFSRFTWMQFEHWHTACQNATLSREAMAAVVGEGELALIERAKQAETAEHSE